MTKFIPQRASKQRFQTEHFDINFEKSCLSLKLSCKKAKKNLRSAISCLKMGTHLQEKL